MFKIIGVYSYYSECTLWMVEWRQHPFVLNQNIATTWRQVNHLFRIFLWTIDNLNHVKWIIALSVVLGNDAYRWNKQCALTRVELDRALCHKMVGEMWVVCTELSALQQVSWSGHLSFFLFKDFISLCHYSRLFLKI